MAIKRHITHIKSQVVTDGRPKLPDASQIREGEIAINYATDYETIAIKNASGDIVTFSSDAYFEGKLNELSATVIDNEEIAAEAINELNDKIDELSGTVIDDEEVISETINYLNDKIDDFSGTVISTEASLANDIDDLNDRIDDLNLEALVEVTYSELIGLINTSGLTKGMMYRITDYTTTTAQADTQSANHPFDVIVTATDVDTVNENAMAIAHSGDTYFSGASLGGWEIKYCPTNDTTRFAWADTTNGKGVIYYMKDEYGNECPYDFKNIQFKRWYVDDITSTTLTQQALESLQEVFIYDYTSNPFHFGIQGSNYTHGGITYIIDGGDYGWYYTFSTLADEYEDDETRIGFSHVIEDASIKGNNFYNDEGGGGCFGNSIKEYYNNMASDEGVGIDGSQFLNNTVFFGYYEVGKSEYNYAYHCFGNSIGYNSRNNTFGNNCYSNSFGNGCSYNSFGNYCYYNSFGNYCYYNSFGNNCNRNSFGNDCWNNTFGNNVGSNTFGNSCYSNSFGNNVGSNTFGNNVGGNTFGNDCWNNTFGNGCNSNSFGNYCYYNSFGNSCYSNSFGNNCNRNSFGNNCSQINFSKDYCYYNIVENGNQYINLTSTQTTSGSNLLRNITIAQGVNNTTTRVTISHNTVNDAFKTTYQKAASTVVNL